MRWWVLEGFFILVVEAEAKTSAPTIELWVYRYGDRLLAEWLLADGPLLIEVTPAMA